MPVITTNPYEAMGLGAGGCPRGPEGDCILNGMPVSCSLIRECDAETGVLHYEYAMPYDTGNVNINVANPQTQEIIGFEDQQGKFVDTTDIKISALQQANTSTAANQSQDKAQVAAQAYAKALAEALARGANAISAQMSAAIAASTATRNYVPSSSRINTQAGSVGTTISTPSRRVSDVVSTQQSHPNLANTPQSVVNQQGTPAAASVTNTNAGSSFGSSIGQNFSDLLSTGTSWLDEESFGIPNKYLAALGLAGGAYLWGNRRLR